MQSQIKGSVETAQRLAQSLQEGEQCACLSEEEYLGLKGPEQLDQHQRRQIYRVFLEYQALKHTRRDPADRVTALLQHIVSLSLKEYPNKDVWEAARLYLNERRLFDGVFADEIQDCTPMEVLLLFAACGGDPTRAFLAGDSAQQVLFLTRSYVHHEVRVLS